MKRFVHPILVFSAFSLFVLSVFIVATPTQKIAAQGMYFPTLVYYHLSQDQYGSAVSSINLTTGMDTRYYLTGMVEDLDGYTDIIGMFTYVYRSGVGAWCTADKNNCYSPFCDSYGSGVNYYFSCPVDFAYYADSTDSTGLYPSDTWKGMMYIYDSAYNAAYKENYSTEMNSLMGLSTSGNINFGNLALGQTSSYSSVLEVYNTGNTYLQLQTSSGGMNCTNGSLEPQRQRYSLWDQSFASMPWAMDYYATMPGIYITPRTDDYSASGTSLYYRISVPSEGVGGTCSGTNIIEPIAI